MNQIYKTALRIFSLLLISICSVATLSSQIQVIPATDDPYLPENLIENVFLGDGVEIISDEFFGKKRAVGVFSNGDEDIGLDRGIVMTTGAVDRVAIPSDILESTGNEFELGDTDLGQIVAPQVIRDLVKYEITFIPISDQLRFEYVFASEEYKNFVCDRFNDVFGFFISGPNPDATGDAYAAKNIALVPGPTGADGGLTFTEFPVSTNTINQGIITCDPGLATCGDCTKPNESLDFSEFYNDNTGSSSFVFDGYSNVLTAQIDVIPCREYTIKLAISDVADFGLSSAVFLKANSFSSPTLKVERQGQQAVDGSISEECTDAIFKFQLPNVVQEDSIIEIEIVNDKPNSATLGEDYTINNVSENFSRVVIDKDTDSKVLTIKAVVDNEPEGEELIQLAYQKNFCNRDTITIILRDKEIANFELEEPEGDFCGEGYTVKQDPPDGAVDALDPIISNQLLEIVEADTSYSDIISVSGVSQMFLTPGLLGKICIDELEHIVPDDLDIYVTSPGGQILELSTDNGGIGNFDATVDDKFINTCFTINATININNGDPVAGDPFPGNPTYTGDFQPEGDWGILFAGDNPVNGDWKLTIRDDSNSGVDGNGVPQNSTNGRLRGWSIQFNSTYEVNYRWSTLEDSQFNDGTISDTSILKTTFSPAQEQTYYLTATDSYGCVITDNITVTPGERVSPPDSLSCGGATSSLIIVNWKNPNMSPGFEVVITEDTLTITDEDWEPVGQLVQQASWDDLEASTAYFIGVRAVSDGCEGDPVFISCETEDCNKPSLITLPSDPSSCRDDGEIIILPNGVAPFTYELNGVAQPDSIFEGLTGGTYVVELIDDLGCANTDTITLAKDSLGVVIVPVAGIQCFGDSTGLLNAFPTGMGGFEPYFEWSNGQEGLSQISASNLRAQTYRVTLTNPDTDCSVVDSIELTQPLPLSVTSINTLEEVSCKGFADAVLSVEVEGGSAPYSYEWQDGSGQVVSDSFIATDLPAGDYNVFVTDSLGCDLDVPTMETVAPNFGFTFTKGTLDPQICAGVNDGSFSYGADPDLSWIWTNELGDTTLRTNGSDALAAGKYFVEMTNLEGCMEFDTIEILPANPFFIDEITVDSTDCFTTNKGVISVSVLGGNGSYENFEWTNTNGQPINVTNQINGAETISELGRGEYTVKIFDTNGCELDTTLVVESPSLIQLDTAIIDPACFGESDGSIDAKAIGGKPSVIGDEYTFQWSSDLLDFTGANPMFMPADTYNVTITDGRNCSVTDMVTLRESTQIQLTLSTTDIACRGDESGEVSVLQGGAIGDVSYEWTKDRLPFPAPDSVFTISDLQRGNYAVTLTDELGCMADTMYTVNEPLTEFNVTLKQDTICDFEDGILEVTPNGGEMPYTYAWSDGSSGSTLKDVAGDYIVTVSDEAGCRDTINATIEKVEIFEILKTIDEAPNCNSNDDGNASSGKATIDLSDINYEFGDFINFFDSIGWSEFPEQDSLTVVGLKGGVEYFVEIKDKFGCKASKSVILEDPPKFDIQTDTVIGVSCFSASDGKINLTPINGEGPFTYAWGPNSEFVEVEDPTDLRNGDHEVTITDTNGCIQEESYFIEEPSLLVVEGRGVSTMCFGENTGRAVLLVSGGTPEYSYLWEDGSTGESLVGLGVDTVSVKVTDGNGCEMTQEVAIMGPTEPLAIDLEVVEPRCAGTNSGIIEVNATGGNGSYLYSYDGVNFFQNQTLVGLVSDNYTVTVKDRNGCSVTRDTVISNQDALTLFIGRDTIIPSGADLFVGSVPQRGGIEVGSDSLDYEWTIEPPDVTISNNETNIGIIGLTQSAIVTLTVRDSLGCEASAIRKVEIESLLNNQVMVPTGFTPNGDGANDILRVLGRDGVTINSFSIYSRWGELVYSDSEYLLDLDDESKGWNGAFKGKPMNPDTFVWVVEATFEDGFQAVYKGNTQLLR